MEYSFQLTVLASIDGRPRRKYDVCGDFYDTEEELNAAIVRMVSQAVADDNTDCILDLFIWGQDVPIPLD